MSAALKMIHRVVAILYTGFIEPGFSFDVTFNLLHRISSYPQNLWCFGPRWHRGFVSVHSLSEA
jgi:hypothetical protein